MARSTNWIFTLNNPTEEIVWAPPVKYAVWQLEEAQTMHYQGYVHLTKRLRLSSMKKILPRAHWEPRKGTHQQAKAYCTKEDTRKDGPWFYGEEPQQGRRNDIAGFRDAIRAKKRKRELLDEYPLMMAKYPKFYCTVLSTMEYEPRLDLKVELHYGKTGLGKTRYAFENYPDLYCQGLSNGYLL